MIFLNQKNFKISHSLELIKPQGSGWSWDDYNYYFASEISTSNLWEFYSSCLQREGVEIKPDFEILESNINSNLTRDRFTNTFEYNLNNWKINDTLYRPFRTSDSLFVNLLSKEIGS